MTKIACIGEAMIELSIDGVGAQVGVAGDTLNTAVYLHRTAPELTVDYLTCLGDDPFSARILDFIADQGLGTSAIQQIPEKTPVYMLSTRLRKANAVSLIGAATPLHGICLGTGILTF